MTFRKVDRNERPDDAKDDAVQQKAPQHDEFPDRVRIVQVFRMSDGVVQAWPTVIHSRSGLGRRTAGSRGKTADPGTT